LACFGDAGDGERTAFLPDCGYDWGILLDKPRSISSWERDVTRRLRRETSSLPGRRLHLAVVAQGYIQLILRDVKTVEARLSVTRQPPFGRVDRGDVIAMKRVSGPIVAIGIASRVWSYELEQGDLLRIEKEFGDRVAADATFWRRRTTLGYATLIELTDVRPIVPIACRKRDQRAWVVLTTKP